MGAIKCLQADCILDIGSRDGDQCLLFRELRPRAYVAAFEASPPNYQLILSRNLDRLDIKVFPYAISNTNGKATFYVVDPEAYPDARGSSSLLVGSTGVKEAIEVETRRIDDFVLEHVPGAQRIALWIDVESAEYEVLEGISKIKDRALVIHTETAIKPVRENQKALPELTDMMNSFGFSLCGSNITDGRVMGDVIFINERARALMGVSYFLCRARALVYYFLPLGQTAVFLKKKFPPLYRFLRQIYIKFAS